MPQQLALNGVIRGQTQLRKHELLRLRHIVEQRPHIHDSPKHWIISNRHLFITLSRLPIYFLVIDFCQSECLFLYICEKIF